MRRSFELKERDDTVITVEAALDVQRLPRAPFFKFRIAGPILGRRTQGSALDFTGAQTAQVAQDQLDRPADRSVSTVAMAEHVYSHIHTDPLANRAVYYDQRRWPVGRNQRVRIELLRA